MIKVTLLGTSALMPIPERALTSAQLVCDGHSILFDCGEGTQTAGRKAGVSLMKTDVIALTHYHGDHIFGLLGLLQTMNVMGRTEPLYIVGPKGIEIELEPIIKLVGWVAYNIILIEIPENGIELKSLNKGWTDGARLIPFKTEHKVVSQGYKFVLTRVGKFMPDRAKALGIPINQWGVLQKGTTIKLDDKVITPKMVMGEPRKGLSVVFSGDTSYCDSLVKASQNTDLLICEATYGENQQSELAIEHGHMNFAQAGQVAENSNAKRLWLVHYSQMIENPEDYIENAQAYFPLAECGYDGKSITLQFDK